jgi:hypothetical protein
MFILLALLPLLMRIKNSLFVVMPYDCSNWENIDIGIDIEKKRQISRKYRIE